MTISSSSVVVVVVVVVVGNKVFIWYHLGFFLGRFKNRVFAVFQSPVFRFYLLTNLECTRARVHGWGIRNQVVEG